jgi:hyperosmotically inducible protein
MSRKEGNKVQKTLRGLTLLLAGAIFFASGADAAINTSQDKKSLTRVEQDVRHELVMLPWYGVFDNLEFQVNGTEVVLSGQVTRPTLKSSAAKVVEQIEGITKVVNNIEVLPLSPNDDRIRLATYRAVLGYGPLTRYSWGPIPPIHIIVKNGDITLRGVVANEGDRNIANIRANGVSGAFSVTNELRLDSKS